jgi:replication factor A2
LDDREIYNIRVVAQIVTAQETATGFSMQLDDGTAMMEARVWMDMSGGHGGADGSGGPGQSDYNVQHRGEWVEGAYVSLVGHPKIFQERRSIVAQRVRTITDHNEITHHMLECLYAHLHNKRGGSGTNQYGGGLSSAPGFGGDGGYGGVPGGGNGQMYDEYNYAGGAQGYGDAGGFTQLQTGILNICRRSNSHGAALTDIIQGLASLGDETAIRAAIQNLTDEGHLYTTIDDEHFKATS